MSAFDDLRRPVVAERRDLLPGSDIENRQIGASAHIDQLHVPGAGRHVERYEAAVAAAETHERTVRRQVELPQRIAADIERDEAAQPADLKRRQTIVRTVEPFEVRKHTHVERRKAVAELAAKYGVVVAEDDPYRDLRYQGDPLPAIKSFDQAGWVVFLGSFSKIISPGLRVDYLAGDPRIIRKCTIGKQSSDVHTANLNQAIVAEFLREGLLPGHIQAICQSYAVQLNAMLKELESFPKGTAFTRPQGGLFIWVELPQGLDATAMLNECVRRHVAYVPGTHFFAEGGHANTLRLNFSNSTVEQIQEGMGVLRDVIAQG